MTVGDVSERDLVARIQRHLAPPPNWLLVGIGDDAAVVEPERNRTEVLTVDALVDGVHFDRAFVPPDAMALKASRKRRKTEHLPRMSWSDWRKMCRSSPTIS